jgi:hypothetical protein
MKPDKTIDRKPFDKRPATAYEDHFNHDYYYQNPEKSILFKKKKVIEFDKMLTREFD